MLAVRHRHSLIGLQLGGHLLISYVTLEQHSALAHLWPLYKETWEYTVGLLEGPV
jgi:hypothetical protein